MTLRDALAAALRRRNPPLPLDEQFVSDADSILSDPAFRAALVPSATAAVIEVLAHDDELHGPDCSCVTLARAIVARMLAQPEKPLGGIEQFQDEDR